MSSKEIYGSSSREGSPTRERTQQRRTDGHRTTKQTERQASEAGSSSMTSMDTAPHQASDESNDSAMKLEMQKMLTQIKHCAEALSKPDIKRVDLMANTARLNSIIGRLAEINEKTSPENKQSIITEIAGPSTSSLGLHQLCQGFLKGHSRRKWMLDSLNAILDQRANQQYNIKSLDIPELVSFIIENKANQEMQWAVNAATREGIRRNNAKYSQNN